MTETQNRHLHALMEERLGKHQRKALAFARTFAGWHGFAKDATTARVVSSLEKRKLLEVNNLGQFRASATASDQ